MSASVRLIQVPYDSGFRDFRMGLGPARLIEAGAAGRLAAQAGAVEVAIVEATDPNALEIALAFELQRRVAEQVRGSLQTGAFPLVFAGNCSATLGALAGFEGTRIGLIWFDSHGDLNTPDTSRSGFLDGMAVSMIVGDCWRGMTRDVKGFEPLREDRIALVGARDLDDGERLRLDASAILEVTCELVGEHGARRALRPVLDAWSGSVDGIYVHVDLDVHDPAAAPFNSYQAPGGLSASQVRDFLHAIADVAPIIGCTLSAYDPGCDPAGKGQAAALDLLQALGERIGIR